MPHYDGPYAHAHYENPVRPAGTSAGAAHVYLAIPPELGGIVALALQAQLAVEPSRYVQRQEDMMRDLRTALDVVLVGVGREARHGVPVTKEAMVASLQPVDHTYPSGRVEQPWELQ